MLVYLRDGFSETTVGAVREPQDYQYFSHRGTTRLPIFQSPRNHKTTNISVTEEPQDYQYFSHRGTTRLPIFQSPRNHKTTNISVTEEPQDYQYFSHRGTTRLPIFQSPRNHKTTNISVTEEPLETTTPLLTQSTLRAHLRRIGVMDSALCDCKETEQTVHHTLQDCSTWRQQRHQLWQQNRWSNTSSRTVPSGGNRDTSYGHRMSQPPTSCGERWKTCTTPPNSWQHVD